MPLTKRMAKQIARSCPDSHTDLHSSSLKAMRPYGCRAVPADSEMRWRVGYRWIIWTASEMRSARKGLDQSVV